MPTRHRYPKIMCEHLIPASPGHHPGCDGKDNPNDEIFAFGVAASVKARRRPGICPPGLQQAKSRASRHCRACPANFRQV
jgi:hypothetical protein